jgi:hypothetical protein
VEFDKPVGSLMKFEDQDYAVLQTIIKEPFVDQAGNVKLPPALIQVQLEAFSDLLLNAVDKEPGALIQADVAPNGAAATA